MNDKDREAKERARSQRAATAPGAVALSHLDDRIADKQRQVLQPQNVRPEQAPGAYQTSALSQLEQEVARKTAAAPPGGSSQQPLGTAFTPYQSSQKKPPPKPQPPHSSSVGAHHGLQSLEDSVTRKAGQGRAQPQVGAFQGAQALEQAVASKVQGEGQSGLKKPPPSSRSAVEDLESAVAAKLSRNAPPSFGRPPPQLGSLEHDVARKSRGGMGSRHAEVAQLEASKIASKSSDRLHDSKSGIEMISHKESFQNSVTRKESFNASFKGKEMADHPQTGLLRGSSTDDLEFGVLTPDGLAVAKPVNEEEEEDPTYLPSAIEYDPDAKPIVNKGTRRRLYAVVAIVVAMLAAVGTGVGVGLSGKNDKDPAGPGNVDDPVGDTRGTLGISEYLAGIVGDDLLQNDPYYSQALEWITYEDPAQLNTTSPTLTQRFIMAYFYFATTVNGDYLSCKPGPEAFCTFSYVNDLGGSKLSYLAQNWLSGSSECDWGGIKCDGLGSVRTLNMGLNGMSATTFPEGLKFLPFLKTIKLLYNEIGGSLPESITSFKYLNFLNLGSCGLSGPMNVWDLRSPQDVWMSKNSLTGLIPPSIENWHDLKVLNLEENELTGAVPEEMAVCKSLDSLRLNDNDLTGQLPVFFASFPNLATLEMGGNAFSGTIPTEYGDLTVMREFGTAGSVMLGGDIPSEVFALTNLLLLDLHGCNYTGTLSHLVGQLPMLQFLDLSDNHLTGLIPSEIGQLTNLLMFSASGNDFTGAMPNEICLITSETGLSDLRADCLEDPTTGIAELECPEGCCSTCCEPDGEICIERN